MKLFEFYIAQRICRSFFLSCLFIIFIAWTIQVLQRINLISGNLHSIVILSKIAYLLFPSILPIVIPFCFVVETTQTLAAMHNNSELLIIDNTGTSRIALMKPVLFLATFLSIFLFIVENTAEPRCRIAIKKLNSEAQIGLIFTSLEEDFFFRLQNNVYIKILKRFPNNILQGIFIADSSAPSMRRVYYAQSGFMNLDNKSLVLYNGEIHLKSLTSQDTSIIKFDSYILDMKSLIASNNVNIKAKDRDLSFLLNPDLNDPQYDKSKIGEYRSELHQRLTQWLFPIIFGLTAIAFINKSGSLRHSIKLHPTFMSLVTSFGVYWSFSYITHSIEQDFFYVPILYLFLLFVLGTLLFVAMRKHTRT
ncbi:MAG: LptF/LptG family permease [Candidatus Liberibacter ctenarytainae]|uniref:LptF/LptG family permease n=1 Tax=Candidatus Liberibacter ctenarytainae TaxID=2020335 RepID=A0A937ABQ9_9HYPH|nr:LptF/LptG family permease [Candidatus Liberibacter ctenarytainae]